MARLCWQADRRDLPEQCATNPLVEELVLCLRKYLTMNKPMFN